MLAWGAPLSTPIKGSAKRYSKKKDCLADIRSRRKKNLLRLSEAPGKMGHFFATKFRVLKSWSKSVVERMTSLHFLMLILPILALTPFLRQTTWSGHEVGKVYMTRSQMLRRVDCNLPAKF